jgi:hypothetical protein
MSDAKKVMRLPRIKKSEVVKIDRKICKSCPKRQVLVKGQAEPSLCFVYAFSQFDDLTFTVEQLATCPFKLEMLMSSEEASHGRKRPRLRQDGRRRSEH